MYTKPTIILSQIPYQHIGLIDSKKYNIVSFKDINYIDDSMGKLLYFKTLDNSIDDTPQLQWYESKVIDMCRVHDLIMMNQIKEANINIPKWYWFRDGLERHLGNIDKDKYYILKVFNQARSMGKMIVNYDMLSKMHYGPQYENYEDFNKEFNIDVGDINNDDEKAITLNCIKNNSFYISELANITKEYRIVYIETMGAGDLVIEERKGYCPNSKEDRKHTVIDTNKFRKDIRKKLLSFAKNLNKVTLSFDVYITPDNEWGLLEYSTQFGMAYEPKIIKHMGTFYNQFLENHFKL